MTEIGGRKAVAGKRVKKIILHEDASTFEFFAVESKDRKRLYIVIPGMFCSCPDFFYSVILKKKKNSCYHLEAVKIAIRENKFDVMDITDEKMKKLIFLKIISGFIG